MLGAERTLAECLDGVHVDHVLEVFIIPYFDLLQLVRSAEAVEEVDERDAALDGCEVSDGGKVHDLLNVGLCQHRKARLTAGHNVTVVTEDVQGVARNGTRADVEHAGQQLARDLVHVRDHQQQTLRSGVGRGQSTCVESAVDRAGSAGLSLHLLHLDGGAEDVLPAGSRPLVNIVGHGAGRGDGVDSGDFGECVGYMGGRVVAVHCFEVSLHFYFHLH